MTVFTYFSNNRAVNGTRFPDQRMTFADHITRESIRSGPEHIKLSKISFGSVHEQNLPVNKLSNT